MNMKLVPMLLAGFVLLAACASPTDTAPAPTPLSLVVTSTGLVPVPSSDALTPIATAPGSTPSSSANVCSDPQITALIDSLKTAVTNQDGPLLASLVSPASGMEVSYFHNGTAIKYDQNQAKF